MNGWDNPAAAEYYEAFCLEHSRYLQANEALIREASLTPGMRVLDLGAGTGRTTEAALPSLGAAGSVICVEPSAAMRSRGQRRVNDPRVTWHDRVPEAGAQFDRVLAGASIWQLDPLAWWIDWSWRAIRWGGALCFNIPALHLCEADEPGGGSDPHLLEVMTLLANGCDPQSGEVGPWNRPPDRAGVEAMLSAAGFAPVCWSFRVRITQAEYAAWLKIPVLTDRLLAGIDAVERARRIDAALAAADACSWKWERWYGWTAWKQ
jgi:SAM-dependent methyltransferase